MSKEPMTIKELLSLVNTINKYKYIFVGGTTDEIWGYIKKKKISTNKGKWYGKDADFVGVTKRSNILLEYNENKLLKRAKNWGNGCLNSQFDSSFGPKETGTVYAIFWK